MVWEKARQDRMRDDIHKGARVSAGYRTLIRAATRDADWPSSAPHRARHAVLAEINTELPRAFVAKLRAILDGSSQPSLFGPKDDVQRFSIESPLPSLARAVVEGVGRRLDGGDLASRVLEAAVNDALVERTVSNMNNIEGHIAVKAPSARVELMRRLRQSAAQVPISEYASKLASGGDLPGRQFRHRELDLDEALPLKPRATEK
jgi:hypothetical protein